MAVPQRLDEELTVDPWCRRCRPGHRHRGYPKAIQCLHQWLKTWFILVGKVGIGMLGYLVSRWVNDEPIQWVINGLINDYLVKQWLDHLVDMVG